MNSYYFTAWSQKTRLLSVAYGARRQWDFCEEAKFTRVREPARRLRPFVHLYSDVLNAYWNWFYAGLVA